MHILYIHQYFTTPDRGGGTRSYEFARRFVRDGHRVTLITKRRKNTPPIEGAFRESYVDGIRVLETPVEYTQRMSFRERIQSFLKFALLASRVGWKQEKPDVVFATSTPLTVGIPGYILSRRFKVPFVFEVRDLWPEVPIKMGFIKNPIVIKLLRWLEWFIYRKASHIVALSPGMRDGIKRRGIKEEKISLIPNSSDLEIFDPALEGSRERQEFGLDSFQYVFYAGALGDVQDINIFLECGTHLAKRPSIKIAIFGGGKNKGELEKKLKEKGLNNVLIFDKTPKPTIARIQSEALASLVVFKNLPVLRYASPNKFFDALAGGKAILTNIDGWLKELVLENNAGIHVGGEDVGKELARAIIYLADNPEEREEMGKNARKLAEKEFDREILYNKLLKVFAEAIRE